MRDYDTALEFDRKALDVYKKLGAKHMEGSALNNIGVVYMRRKDFDKALTFLDEARTLMVQIGDKRREATCLLSIGMTYKGLHNNDLAIEHLMDGLELAVPSGDPRLEATLEFELAPLFWERGSYSVAVQAMENSRRIKREFNVPTNEEDAILQEWWSITGVG